MPLNQEIQQVQKWAGPALSGRVTQVIGLLIESRGPSVQMDEVCYIYGKEGEKIVAQVVGFKEDRVLLMPFTDTKGLAPGVEVFPSGGCHKIKAGYSLLGRVLDAMGNPIDGKGSLFETKTIETKKQAPSPLSRREIQTPLITKVRAIDALTTLAEGQRMGIFSGAGVGKSTLLATLAHTEADINVIALIGERGREVKEFVEKELGPKGLARSVVVVATAEQPALFRSQGAFVATALAEFFRDEGKKVLLMVDSISRFAYARREIGLAIGEPPTSRGYTPSVFALLPQLVERAGMGERGSITALYTILVEGDDWQDPIADAMRSHLDGHITLDRKLASRGHYPPIDILKSLSRVQKEVVAKDHLVACEKFRSLLSTFEENEDLIKLGAYVKGSLSKLDEAIEKRPQLLTFLQQKQDEFTPFSTSIKGLKRVV